MPCSLNQFGKDYFLVANWSLKSLFYYPGNQQVVSEIPSNVEIQYHFLFITLLSKFCLNSREEKVEQLVLTDYGSFKGRTYSSVVNNSEHFWVFEYPS